MRNVGSMQLILRLIFNYEIQVSEKPSKAGEPTRAMTTTSPPPTIIYALLSLGLTFVAAIIIVAGATRWLPTGAAEIDHIVIPAVVFPLVWVTAALGVYGARYRLRAWGALAAIVFSQLGAILWGVWR